MLGNRTKRLVHWLPLVAAGVLMACAVAPVVKQLARTRLDPRAQQLLTQLRDPSPRLRLRAASSFRNRSRRTVEAAIPELVKQLADETPLPNEPQRTGGYDEQAAAQEGATVAQMAAEALAAAGDPAVEPLLQALRDRDARVRRGAALALARMAQSGPLQMESGRLQQAAGPALRRALSDADASVATMAAIALGALGEEKGLEQRLAAASAGPVETRRLALSSLGAGPTSRVRPVLWRALEDPEATIRSQAAMALARAPSAESAGRLRAALHDPDAQVRSAAASALGALGDFRAVGPLFALLRDQDQQVHDSAESALGNIRDPRALPALLTALKQPEPVVAVQKQAPQAFGPGRRQGARGRPSPREVALRGIAGIGGPRVVAPMAGLLHKSTDPQERQWAIIALGAARDPRALEVLFALPQGRGEAFSAIGRIGGPRAEQFLLARLRSPEWLVREAAIEALAQMRSRAAVPAIMTIAREAPSWKRRSVIGALCQIADPRAMPLVLPLLQERDPNLRHAAVRALGEMGDPRALPDLRPLRGDADFSDQAAVVIAMGKLGDHSVFDSLVGYLSNPHYLRGEYRLDSARALARLKDPAAVPALIEALREEAQEDARVPLPAGGPSGATTAVAEALRALTGQHFGTDAAAWQQWWEAQSQARAPHA